MKLILFIARRYFFSWKKKTIINIISIIAVLAVMACTATLIMVLSAFNGMDSFVKDLFGKFDSDLTIFPTEGKSFVVNDPLKQLISETNGIELYSEVIEDNALLKYRDKQIVAKVKGIDSKYLERHSIDGAIATGSSKLMQDSIPYALIGVGVAHKLNVAYSNNMYPLQFMYPKNKKFKGSLSPNLLNHKNIRFAGTFAIERQYDEYYTFVPLEFASKLTEFKDKRTSIEIRVNDQFSIGAVKQDLQNRLGNTFVVKDSNDLHIGMLVAHNMEKLFVFLMFSFILLIASLNIFFALSMLIMEKQKDIAVMKSMGFSSTDINRIYLTNGFFVSMFGTLLGLVLGYGLVILQQQFGLVSMGMSSGLIDSYPVELRFQDFVYVMTIVTAITFLVSVIPARKASKIVIAEHL